MIHIGWLSPPFFDTAVTLAHKEGWIMDTHEWDYLFKRFPTLLFGAFCEGVLIGTVTAYRHEKSAYIGNFLVDASYRSQGIGRRLFETILRALYDVPCIYLHANPDIVPFYETYGFVAHNTLTRFHRLRCEGEKGVSTTQAKLLFSADFLHQVQKIGTNIWGENRRSYIEEDLMGGSSLTFASANAFCHSRIIDGIVAVGPWVCRNGAYFDAEIMLRGLIGYRGAKGLMCDVFDSNTEAHSLVKMYNFLPVSHSVEMVRGEPLESIYEAIFAPCSLGAYG